MKKSVVAMLTGALVVGATATTFAAANPFSDVPAGHWAYNAVTKLAAEGVIEGYGDGTFRGNRNITRYEMAQMIARAMAKTPKGSNADLDKLAAEFRDELDSLGVRVAELEKHADKVKWAGKIEYTYNHWRVKEAARKKERGMTHSGVFRLEPRAEVNSHWTAVARFDAEYDGRNDSTGHTDEVSGTNSGVKLKRIYAEGKYNKFDVKVGRFEFCPAYEDGMVADSVISGIDVTFGSKWKFDVTAGRVGGSSDESHYGYIKNFSPIEDSSENNMDVVAIHATYADNGEKGLFGTAGWYWAKDKDFQNYYYSKDAKTDKANVWVVDLGYRFNEKLKLWGGYAHNTKADEEKSAWQAEVRYGTYDDYAKKGDWAVWAGYSKFGYNVAIASGQGDDVFTGMKGWHVGAAYAPFRNVGLLARYADGKEIETGVKIRHVFGRVEFFF